MLFFVNVASADAANYEYDVCLSFAGEQREYVEEVALALRAGGIRVFYDDFERVSLWGRDLYDHLDWVYRSAARYCVLFVSADYAEKVWTSHERRSAQARALGENSEYVLPARFDDTEVPGLRPTVGHVDVRDVEPTELAQMVRKKLGAREHRNFFPPIPDKLFEAVDAVDEDEKEAVTAVAYSFMQSLQRMSTLERRLIAEIFKAGCPAELPVNMHISLDLVRRDLRMPPAETLRTLRGLRSVGFVITTRESEDGESDDEMVVVEWDDRSAYDFDEETLVSVHDQSTEIAHAMLQLADQYCLNHTVDAVEALDFSALSSATS